MKKLNLNQNKKRSIYKEFATKLIIATTLFTIIVSFMFFGFTKATIYEDITEQLIKKAKLIRKTSIESITSNEQLKLIVEDDLLIDLVKINKLNDISFRHYKNKHNDHLIELLYPFTLKNNLFIKLTKNINREDTMLKKIFSNVFILAIGGLAMIILYALAVSKTLMQPIINISKKLSKMNEHSLSKIDESKLPEEFLHLAISINNLTKKIENYVKYQKELFIGAAHELKTPLAVMKLKSEVTLIKKRPIEKYEEVLKLHVNEINGMNTMISSILDMGRQEGAQFEKPIEIDIGIFLKDKITNFSLLTKEKNITIKYMCFIDTFIINIQVTLLNQIIQNFMQNAIKFTKENSTITVISNKENDLIFIDIIDEGDGIDESIDLFAPFKRVGNAQGAGLGLYLAKSAADTIGAIISLKNRTDGKNGCVANITLSTNPTCPLPV